MKKIVSLVLSILMLSSFTACQAPSGGGSGGGNGGAGNSSSIVDNDKTESSKDDDGNGGNDDNNSGDDDGGQISPSSKTVNMDDIVFSSVYSDGVAIVNLVDDKETAYAIDKKGRVIFDFQLEENYSSYTINNMKFENGMLVYNGICYDTKGNVTTPESVGATSFVDFKYGEYIIAEKITSTYNSSTKELGVLNTDFEWILPLKEGYYGLYHSNTSSYSNFFWEVVYSNNNATKKFIFNDDYSGDGNIYFSDGRVLSPKDIGVDSFVAVYEDKYILTRGYNDYNAMGILGMDGKWVLEPQEEFWNIYRNNDSFKIESDILSVRVHDYDTGDDYIAYYNLLTKDYTMVNAKEVLSSYCEKAALNKIVYAKDGSVSEKIFGGVAAEKINNLAFYDCYKDYIIVEVEQEYKEIFNREGEQEENDSYGHVFAVMDREFNWLVSGIFLDSYGKELKIKGDYLCISDGWSEEYMGYYNLKTKESFTEKPSDFPEEDEVYDDYESSDGFDFSSIDNFHAATDFVNGKAAVALWNSDVNEMYITVVDEKGEFLFTPIKTAITTLDIFGTPLYFDGEYIVLADNTGFGSGHTRSSMTIYTYSVNGEKLGEWKASNDISTWNCSFEYNDGVIVFWLISGQYSNYYRQSRVKYYTVDFQPLF